MPGRSICYPGRPSAWGAHRLWSKHVPTTPSSSRRLWYGLRPVLAYSGRDISAAAGSLQVSRLPAPRRPVLGRGTGRGYGPRTACLICGRKPPWLLSEISTHAVLRIPDAIRNERNLKSLPRNSKLPVDRGAKVATYLLGSSCSCRTTRRKTCCCRCRDSQDACWHALYKLVPDFLVQPRHAQATRNLGG